MHVHLYPSRLTHESRILKVTKSLTQSGIADTIHIVGIHETPLLERQDLDAQRLIWRVRLRIPRIIPKLKSVMFYLEWYVRVLFRYRHAHVPVIHCNSLYDLPLGVLLKGKSAGAKLVYDAHELETERNGLSMLGKRIAKATERLLIRQVDQIFTVSPSIAAWYQQEYPTRPVALIRNRPCISAEPLPQGAGQDLRQRFGIGSGLVFLYYGALIPGRGVDVLLDVFSRTRRDRHIIFMGYGPREEKIRAHARQHANIHLHEAVAPDELQRRSEGADVGMALIENTCLSYYYCLPNKLYEYMAAGLAVIVSDFPDMSAEVERFQNGWRVTVSTPALLELVNSLHSTDVEEKKRRSLGARPCIGWKSEEEVLFTAYRRLLVPLTQELRP